MQLARVTLKILLLFIGLPELSHTGFGRGRQDDIVEVEAAWDLWLLNYVPTSANPPKNDNVSESLGYKTTK